ncbi:alpha/beta fold hydrolase [Actinomadura sp. CNU-125]|uniref:alpha/beta fold hydrolase n=1 Tax=Actinomadura sp. CNU-125 TaxID=1904961 RepID=UPI0021CC77CB|nr:alpha/beta hydrolase [Actinomadura sp. CNU-125]
MRSSPGSDHACRGRTPAARGREGADGEQDEAQGRRRGRGGGRSAAGAGRGGGRAAAPRRRPQAAAAGSGRGRAVRRAARPRNGRGGRRRARAARRGGGPGRRRPHRRVLPRLRPQPGFVALPAARPARTRPDGVLGPAQPRTVRAQRPDARDHRPDGRDLAAVLAATVGPDDPVVLAGHSMGGMSIMSLAERRPELFARQVVGIALVNTSCGNMAELTLGLPMVVAKAVRPLAPGALRGLGQRAALVERARGLGADLAFVVTRKVAFADRHVSPSVVAFLDDMIRDTPIDVIAEFYPSLMGHDKSGALGVLAKVPALVLVGGRDKLTPAAHGRRIAEALPDAELVEVEDAGHVLPLEYPGVVTGGLRRLLGRVRPEIDDVEERTA